MYFNYEDWQYYETQLKILEETNNPFVIKFIEELGL